jgi:hypothetical protein
LVLGVGKPSARWNSAGDAEMIAQAFEDREALDQDDVDYLFSFR